MRAAEKAAHVGTDQAFAELGLPTDASDAEIKAAWRRLVSRWHPDRNRSSQAVARMQRINQAFEAIGRARQGDATPPAPAPEPPPASPPPAPAAAPRPPTLRRKLRLTLEQAAAGCVKTLRGQLTPLCGDCQGRGHRVLDQPCRRCRGSGACVRPSAWFGWPGQRETCADCAGTGIARAACTYCAGSGKLAPLAYQVQARIPAGVRAGDLLHVPARRAGIDLEVQVALAPHPLFTLDAAGTLHCRMPVDGFAWMAQRSVAVPTLDGQVPLALRRDQRQYRLPGLGFASRHGSARGELVVEIEPIFPDSLGTDQQILLDQLIASNAGPHGDARLAAWQQTLRRHPARGTRRR